MEALQFESAATRIRYNPLSLRLSLELIYLYVRFIDNLI